MKDNRWVDSRLSSLAAPAGWRPDAAASLVKFEERKRAARSRRKRLLWAWASAFTICAGALWVPVSGSCAPPPAGCTQQRLWQKLLPAGPAAVKNVEPPADEPKTMQLPASEPPAAPAQAPPLPVTPRRAKSKNQAAIKPAIRNFKESGSPAAQVTCEVYTDYQCPACGVLYRDVIPLLVAEYVDTGKIKLLHRDFPLLVHAHARVAARYANAAGQLGHYEAAVKQIFASQPQWSATGDVDAALAQTLPPDVMQKIRELVVRDSTLDQGVEADVAAGRQDQLNRTPSFVIVSNGKRQLLPGTPSYSLLKTYLDQVLAGQ
jgi:protein-disulfide isomerase